MKNLVYIITFLMLATSVFAVDVGIIVELADGSEYLDCVQVSSGGTAYDALRKTSLDLDWQDFGFGEFLNAVEGVASEDVSGFYWSFWHINNAENDFEAAMVGVSDYDINDNGHVLGISYTDFDLAFNPKNEPDFQDFEDVCQPSLQIDSVKAYVDGDKENLDEGDSVEVKPGSELIIEINLENVHEDVEVEDVYVEVTIEDIDGGSDLEEDDDIGDINEDDEETVEFSFDIPLDAEDGDYNMIITVRGDGFVPVEIIQEFEVEVEKEDHELVMRIPDRLSTKCGEVFEFTTKINNIGEKDETASFSVANNLLDINHYRTFEVDDEDDESKTFTLSTPRDAKAGNYQLISTLSYSGLTGTGVTVLSVDCEETKSSVSTITTQTANSLRQTTTNAVSKTSDVTTQATQKAADSLGIGYMAALIIGNLILIAIIILLLR